MDENKRFGSATRLNGKTVIVSVFVDDKTTKWEFDKGSEIERAKLVLERLKTATDWIREQTRRFGAKTEFIYDWSVESDLFKRAKYDKDMIWTGFDSENLYYPLCRYIDANIDSAAIKRKYQTNSVIYLFFYDTDVFSKGRAHAFSYRRNYIYPYEMCNIYCRSYGSFVPPGAIAHEMLHTFGAPDLYYANDFIKQEYVDYCKRAGVRDIMYQVGRTEHKVDGEFSSLDAYYTGLINNCKEVERWNLGKSVYLTDGF